jgi:formate dehydrogenase subunit gamma
MFATITIISLLATVLAVVVHYLVFGPRRADTGPTSEPLRRWSAWQRCLHGVSALSFIVLAVTGFVAAIGFDEFEGWWLWAHLLAAPVFAVSLTVTAVIWAERCRFAPHDGEWLRCGGGYFGGAKDPPADKFDAGQKLFFWSALILGFLVLASMMAEMVSLFSQVAAAILCAIHRYSALGLLIVVILHTYVTILAKPGTWRGIISGYVDTEWARRYHRLWWSHLNTESEQNHEA